MKRTSIHIFAILLLFLFAAVRSTNATPQSAAPSVTLTWIPSIQPANEAVASWNIYRSMGNVTPYSLLSNVPAQPAIYLDAAVMAGSTYSYVVTAVDTSGIESIYSQCASVTIPGAVSLLAVTTTTLPAATVGASYTSYFAATGGSPPYSWSDSGVPGLTLSSAGLLSGTPTQSGTYTEIVTVTDSLGTVASASISVNVANATPAPISGAGFPSGLALYWPFDANDVSNGVVVDDSGNNNTGTVVGNALTVAGELNQALSFDGSTSYILAGTGVGGLSQSLTLAAWINTANASRTEAILSDFDASASGAGYIFTTDQNGNLDLRIGGSDLSGYPNYLTDPTTINDGEWHHVVVTISFELQTVAFYMDGNPTSSSPVNIVANGSGGAILQVAVNPWQGYGDYFTGAIEQVQIYNRALAASEVNSLYLMTGGSPSS